MATQETRGKVKQVKGRGKEIVGILTGNEKLEREGVLRRVSAGVSDRVTHIQPTTAYVAEIMAEADEQTAAEYRTTLGLATWGQQILR